MIRRAQNGFTVVEVIVATAITGLLLIIIMSFLIDAVVTNTIDAARGDTLREAQLALDSIGRDIRLSSNADENNRLPDSNAPNSPGDDLSWESNDQTLVLATAALDSGSNIIFSDPLHYISSKNNNIYFVSNDKLYKRTVADPAAGNIATTTCPPSSADSCTDDRELINGVQDFTVRYFDVANQEVDPASARSIELTLDIHKEKYGRNIDASFTTRTVFRNE